LGGSRTRVAEKWAEQVRALLDTIKDQKTLEYEQRFYSAVLAALDRYRPATVPTGSEVADSLLETEGQLRRIAVGENEQLKRLKRKPAQVLIGNGIIVV